MSNVTLQAEIASFRKLRENAGRPQWLIQMQDDYARTGVVRVEDLRRLIGDSNRRVDSSPQATLPAFVAGRK